MYYDSQFKSQINTCIRYVITRNVKEFDLSFCLDLGDPSFEFDQFFYMSSCFNHLKLKFCLLKPSGAISWSKLKNLSISDVELDEESIQNILSGSPLLETLEFNECFGFRRIDITSKSVKNLVFCGYVHNYGRDIIEINAPYIQSLAIQYILSLWKFSLHDVSSLVKDELDY
ncbi:F-box/LRR-repeat protein 25-like protein [Tanacetum coccineum]